MGTCIKVDGFFVYHIVTVGKGVSSEGDEDSTTTWADWTVGRETEGAHMLSWYIYTGYALWKCVNFEL